MFEGTQRGARRERAAATRRISDVNHTRRASLRQHKLSEAGVACGGCAAAPPSTSEVSGVLTFNLLLKQPSFLGDAVGSPAASRGACTMGSTGGWGLPGGVSWLRGVVQQESVLETWSAPGGLDRRPPQLRWSPPGGAASGCSGAGRHTWQGPTGAGALGRVLSEPVGGVWFCPGGLTLGGGFSRPPAGPGPGSWPGSGRRWWAIQPWEQGWWWRWG